MECMLPEIIQPFFPIRMLKSDIREPARISDSINNYNQQKKKKYIKKSILHTYV